MAADLPVKAPPPAPAPPSPWTLWLEGGAQCVIGDAFVPGLTPPFDAKPDCWGWDVAGSVDYRFNAYWHGSVDFRFGENRRNFNTFQNGCLGAPGTCSTPISGPNSATRKEDNWVADFMIGRDIGLGSGNSQIQGGLRIAEIRGTTNGNMLLSSQFGSGTAHDVYQQNNYFFGAGPRVAIEGSAPLGGPWFLDYMGGIAGLFAHRSTNQTAGFTTNEINVTCVGNGCAINASISDNGFVFNPDAMLGIGYAISPTTKLSINYHVDAYFDALKVLDAGGNPTHANRIYHGPSLRLTWVWP